MCQWIGFNCTDTPGQWVTRDKICDGTPDCLKGEDERSCADFLWRSAKFGVLSWASFWGYLIIFRGFFFGVILEAIFSVGFVKRVEVSCYDFELSRAKSSQ